MSVTKGQKLGASIAATVVAVGVGAARFGDDVGRNLDDLVRAGKHTEARPVEVAPPRPPELPAPGGIPLQSGHADVQPAIDDGASVLERDYSAGGDSARRAAESMACNLIETSLTNLSLPSEDDWAGIVLDALAGSLIDVPPGSQPWYTLERLKNRVETAITDPYGEVDEPSADDLAADLGCELLR